MIREDLQQAAERLCEKRDKWFDEQERKEQEPKYCDRNICLRNEYNNIGCDECEVTKSQISGAEAIKAIDEKAKRIKNEDTLNGLAGAVGILFDLPSVKPQEPTDENLHREREQAYMQGYEDASKRFRQEPCDHPDRCHECEKILTCTYYKQESKIGHWIFEGNQCFSCSSCGRIYTQKAFEYLKLHKDDSDFPNNCPNCGIRMVELQEGEECKNDET